KLESVGAVGGRRHLIAQGGQTVGTEQGHGGDAALLSEDSPAQDRIGDLLELGWLALCRGGSGCGLRPTGSSCLLPGGIPRGRLRRGGGWGLAGRKLLRRWCGTRSRFGGPGLWRRR